MFSTILFPFLFVSLSAFHIDDSVSISPGDSHSWSVPANTYIADDLVYLSFTLETEMDYNAAIMTADHCDPKYIPDCKHIELGACFRKAYTSQIWGVIPKETEEKASCLIIQNISDDTLNMSVEMRVSGKPTSDSQDSAVLDTLSSDVKHMNPVVAYVIAVSALAAGTIVLLIIMWCICKARGRNPEEIRLLVQEETV